VSFHWTPLMQYRLDITGTGYDYKFILLYTLETSYSIVVLCSEKIQHSSTT